ncbi:MAG TPA: ATP-binding protein [Dokdonella sp.]|uniref:Dph6-related ATP pyrophosphatase n=1 Tax=Dokdonella sp. TaxID=2291710 RepID=UPI002D7E8505|nr:ATP-binding protein [Dokdonella sp.]HET9034350.1 ATP-binding protein [Dokdonella sp.]
MATSILVAWSGGKDCLMALDRLLADPHWKVSGLLTTLDRTSDRVAMHDVHGDVLRAQAAALKLPLIEMAIDWPAPNEVYESALASALDQARLKFANLAHVAFGDIFLADIREWREASLDRLGWKPVFPLWNTPTRELAKEFLRRGHRAVVTTIDLDQLDGAFCGREFDSRFLAELPDSVDACGENGEFHTLCHASPLFSTPMLLESGVATTRSGRFRSMDYQLV